LLSGLTLSGRMTRLMSDIAINEMVRRLDQS
jgi:hypothetical protein